MILERLQVLLDGDTTGLAGAFRKLAVGITAGAVFHKIIDESSEAQYAMAQLEAAVESTGGAAGRSVEKLDAMSQALQRETTFSDDAVKSAEAMLLTFTKVGGPTFDRALVSILDVATAMGTDTKSAAVQLGKALNDPVAGITALTRVGVTFSDSQKEVIKNLVETNRLAEAQGIILDELEREFGGSARAARSTLGGALEHLSNVWGDLFEVEDTEGMVAAIDGVADALPRLRTEVDRVFTGYQRMVSWGRAALATGLEQLGQFEAAAKLWDSITGPTITRARMGRHLSPGGPGGPPEDDSDGADRIAKSWEKANQAALEAKLAIDKGKGFADPESQKDLVAAETHLDKLKEQLLAIDKVAEESDAFDALTGSVVSFAELASNAVADFALGAEHSFKDFVDAALAQLTRLVAKLLIVRGLKSIFAGSTSGIGGAILGALEGRASGGPVSGGRPYIVGERGPELFVPAGSGSIVPNGGGNVASSVRAALDVLGPIGRPGTPREASRDAWHRELFKLTLEDYLERA